MLFAFGTALGIVGACRHQEEARPPAEGGQGAPASEGAGAQGNATIVVHGMGDGWTMVAAPVLQLGNGGRGTSRQSLLEGEHLGDGYAVDCLARSLCAVEMWNPAGAPHAFDVVTGDASAEVHVVAATDDSGSLEVGYRDPASRSARIAGLLEKEAALVRHCRAETDGRCGGARVLPDPGRVVDGYEPGGAIEELHAGLVDSEDGPLATWAYFDAGCPDSPIDVDLARRSLARPVEPIATSLWPVGIARAIMAAEGRAGAEARLAAMRAPEERDLAAALMVELVNEARRQHEFSRAVELRARLREENGPWKGSSFVDILLADPGVLGIDVSSLGFRVLVGDRAGDRLTVADEAGRPVVLYSAASWCPPCAREGLPQLRALAEEHPEVVVLFAMWDEDAATAAAYVEDHSPVPGTVVSPDDDARAELEVLLGLPSFPSFLVIDGRGRIAALPGSDDLETIVQRSGVLAER